MGLAAYLCNGLFTAKPFKHNSELLSCGVLSTGLSADLTNYGSCPVGSDGAHNYNVMDVSEFKHYRINHSELFVDQANQINGIVRISGTR